MKGERIMDIAISFFVGVCVMGAMWLIQIWTEKEDADVEEEDI